MLGRGGAGGHGEGAVMEKNKRKFRGVKQIWRAEERKLSIVSCVSSEDSPLRPFSFSIQPNFHITDFEGTCKNRYRESSLFKNIDGRPTGIWSMSVIDRGPLFEGFVIWKFDCKMYSNQMLMAT